MSSSTPDRPAPPPQHPPVDATPQPALEPRVGRVGFQSLGHFGNTVHLSAPVGRTFERVEAGQWRAALQEAAESGAASAHAERGKLVDADPAVRYSRAQLEKLGAALGTYSRELAEAQDELQTARQAVGAALRTGGDPADAEAREAAAGGRIALVQRRIDGTNQAIAAERASLTRATADARRRAGDALRASLQDQYDAIAEPLAAELFRNLLELARLSAAIDKTRES